MRFSLFCLTLVTILSGKNTLAVDLTGRFSMLGATAQAEEGDWGYQDTPGDLLSADQQSLRLMVGDSDNGKEWSAHLRTVRIHTQGFMTPDLHSSDLFRYSDLGGTLLDESDGTTSTASRYELDRLYYRHHFNDYTLTLGRHAIDWGSGRFWQPLNVFGSFSPTDLDTDYKPGIDALAMDYFPSQFSSLSGVYAFAPHDQSTLANSGALHYRGQVGGVSEIALVAGKITGNTVVGASFESAWHEIGWRIEGLYYDLNESDQESLFWIAGVEYQFDDGTLLSAEYYDNSRGATTESELVGLYSDTLIAAGLQQQLSRHLVGIGLARDLTPLLRGSYTLLGSALDDESSSTVWSLLHQMNITYSVSNESDLLLSLLLPGGKGLTLAGEPQSEFGHIPMTFTLRLRFYF